MKYSRLFLALSVIASAQIVSAACKYSNLSVKTEEKKLPFKLEIYNGVLRKVDEILCDMDKQTNIVVTLSKSGDNAFYNFMGGEIQSIAAFEKYGPAKTGHPIYGQFILAHEYTHSVFTINLGKASAKYAVTLRKQMALVKLENLSRDLETQMEKITDPELRKQTYDKIQKAQDGMQALQMQLESSVVFQASGAINEFFADLVPVLLTGNPRAIYQALKKADKADKFSDQTLIRDFSQNYGPQVLARWETAIKAQILQNGLRSIRYSSLAPLRSFVWEIIKGPAQNPANRARIAKAIFDVLAQDLESRFSPEMDLSNFDVKKWNLDLAAQIKAKLK